MSPYVKTAQVNESGTLTRNLFAGIVRAVFCVAVLWIAMRFFFAWQDGRISSLADAGAKIASTIAR